MKTFPIFPERQSRRRSFSDFLKVTTFTKKHLSPLVPVSRELSPSSTGEVDRWRELIHGVSWKRTFQQASCHNLQLLRADLSAADRRQLLRLFCNSTHRNCSKNTGRWQEICLVKQITQKYSSNICSRIDSFLDRGRVVCNRVNVGEALVGVGFWTGTCGCLPCSVVSRNCTFSTQK